MTERTPFNYPEFFRDVARIAVPVALQHLLTTTGSMVDTVMLGRLGENTVGAVVGLTVMALHGPLFTAMGLSGESFAICTFLCGYYCLIAVIRMGNWQQNDIFRAGGDPAFGSIMEITFMFLMVIPLVYISHFVFHAPFKTVFLCVYSDEIIRYVIMQRRLFSGKWIQPVSEAGTKTIGEFRKTHNIS